jgi:hypothetical protein
MHHQMMRQKGCRKTFRESAMNQPRVWKKLQRCASILFFGWLVVAQEGAFAQTNGCDEGVIRLPDRNGTIQICSAIAGQVPQLTQQLKDAVRTLGGQETQIKELTRLVKGLNGTSRSIGEERQAQMLKTLSADLAKSQRNGEDRTRQMLSGLTQQLEDLQSQLTTSLNNTVTTAATQASLKGDVGNSISKLEFASASRQLDEISAKLGVIDGRVQDVKIDTADIRKKLEQMQNDRDQQKQKDEEFLIEMQRQSEQYLAKIKQESQVQKAESDQKRLESPNSFGRIFAHGGSTLPSLGQPIPWRLSLKLSLKDRSWNDAEILVIGRPENSQPWLMDLSQFIKTSKTGGTQSIEGGVNAPPGDITVCFTVFDSLRNRRMTLSASYDADVVNRYLKGFEHQKDEFGGPKQNLAPEPSSVCSRVGYLKAVFSLNQDIYRLPTK